MTGPTAYANLQMWRPIVRAPSAFKEGATSRMRECENKPIKCSNSAAFFFDTFSREVQIERRRRRYQSDELVRHRTRVRDMRLSASAKTNPLILANSRSFSVGLAPDLSAAVRIDANIV